MILSFSRDIFVERILSGVKKHTIRTDSHNRWKTGMSIQFWRGNPRNTRGKNKPYQFAVGNVECMSPIKILPSMDSIILDMPTDLGFIPITLRGADLESLARKDGFESWAEMKEFFEEDFNGKLIWWENLKEVKK